MRVLLCTENKIDAFSHGINPFNVFQGKTQGNEKFRSFALTVNTSLLVIHILVVEVEDADGHVVGLLSGTFRVAGDGL